MESGDDILMVMARELVTEQHIGESADEVWRALQKERAEAFGARAVEALESAVEPEPPDRGMSDSVIVPPAMTPTIETQLLMFGARLETARRRRSARRLAGSVPTSDQLALFNN
ncbi:MAG: hypothetical protein EPN47_04510 [Acidobacteria bacterium]|nr:MAG: hypothetical protein EPN47_04510 [Acidobacteriota bacterium]